MNKLNTFVFAAIFPVMLFAQWQKIPVDFEPVHIAVTDTGTIWSITTDYQNRFTKSTDGGQSWTGINVPDLLDDSLYTATITAINNNEAWVYFRLQPTYEQHLYRTYNGGQTWNTLPMPGNSLVFFCKTI